MTHELKTDSAVFFAALNKSKRFEIRLNDRNFKVGDTLHLRETESTGEEIKNGAPLKYTGITTWVTVTYILHGPIYGLLKGWVIMSIE